MTEPFVINELEKEACLRLRPLWEEVFYEDSKDFTDYYFQEKAVRNHSFALRIEGEDISMLYLSPYEMMIKVGDGFQSHTVNYIVGVATRKEYRHRGYMDRVLKASLRYMYGKRQPFAFLMPANPEIYHPYQFTYIYDRQEVVFRKSFDKGSVKELANGTDIAELTEYAASYLGKSCDVFIRRDEEYFRTMIKELKAQNGGIYLLQEEEAIKGYFLYTEEEGKGEIQEAVVSENIQDCPVLFTGNRIPAIMARIVDVQKMFSLLRAETEEIILTIAVSDPILTENNGNWKCRISRNEAHIYEGGSREGSECRIAIERLTSWIFGYEEAKDCFVFPNGYEGWEKEKVLYKLNKIKILKNVFINEIV